ncbi:MAG: tRNA pseudouridine(38-40) synthase TruA [Faecousia sp.]
MRNLRLDLCYDGTRYRGWQRLSGESNTIQGKLEQALSRILEEPIEISGSGRTDAGVHALGQVASFHCESAMPPAEILAQLRRYLPEDIGIYSCKEAAPRFHARLNAKRKTYCYRIWNSDAPCVFQRRYVAPFPETLDVDAMDRAGQQLVGEHDFAAFCSRAKMKKSTLREIYDLSVKREGDEIRICVTADGFLYNMMRIIAGTLIEVGRGERSPESIPSLFTAQRCKTGFLAPPQGLCLMEVEY